MATRGIVRAGFGCFRNDLERDIRRVGKRLSREIRKTNQEAQKTNESVWRLRVDMQVVKDRLNIGDDSRPVASAPVESDPEADLSASSDSVAVGPAPGSSESGSGVSVPVADDAVSRPVGSRAAAHRQGGAGVVPSGITAPLPAAEKQSRRVPGNKRGSVEGVAVGRRAIGRKEGAPIGAGCLSFSPIFPGERGFSLFLYDVCRRGLFFVIVLGYISR